MTMKLSMLLSPIQTQNTEDKLALYTYKDTLTHASNRQQAVVLKGDILWKYSTANKALSLWICWAVYSTRNSQGKSS